MERILVQNAVKKFGNQKVLNNFSFELKSGEILAFLGANGAGKTTTIRCLLGIYSANNGTFLVDGAPYTSNRNHLIGYLPEERGIYTKARVDEVLLYFAALRGVSKTDAKLFLDEYLELTDLKDHVKKNVSELSSGMQQKIQIATAVIHKPPILILDEPYKGLDAVNRQLFGDYFKKMNKEYGTAILYSTHVVDEAQKTADRVVMIKNGMRAAYGSINEVRTQFGTNNIHLQFNGDFKMNEKFEKLFSARIEHKVAELTPLKGIDPQVILKTLLENHIQITEFKIDRPSLQDIFIKIQNT